MKDFDLTPEEVQELRAALRSAKKSSASEAYRINTILLLGTGWSVEEVVDALFLDGETLKNYAKKYREGGLEELLERKYKGGTPKLPVEYFKILSSELESNIYLSTKNVCEYVKSQFNIEYTISGMTALLHRMGYVYKKPKLVPANPDEDSQECFLKEFSKFMKNKKKDEAVFFVDAVHPTWNSMAAYGWIKKGSIRELKSNSGRGRFNIHGAMNAETFETTVVTSESNVDSDSTLALMKALEIYYPLAVTIYMILDNARYHFSKPILDYVKNSRIRLVFLPSYSPELNLIERLWRVFKKNVLYNRHYKTFEKFKKACLMFFENQEDYIHEIESITGSGLEALA
jgi:transposase